MPVDKHLRAALDGTPLAGKPTGIGAFCAGLLAALARRPDLDVGAFAISRRGRADLDGKLPEGVRPLGPRGRNVPARVLHSSWRIWPFPPAELWAGGAGVVHGTNFVVPPAWRAATVVTVHDLTPLRYPNWCLPAARAYPELVRRAVARGAWVHADSEFVADEVRSLLRVPAERVRAIYPGIPPVPDPTAAEPPEDTGSPSGALRALLPPSVTSYVLALGTVEPRKGFPDLVKAFGRIAGRHPGLALVIAGPDGWATHELSRAVGASSSPERVVRLGWVSTAQRDSLLRGATVFAYPSLYEGFGLPPLEAMAAGTAVIASDIAALREVLGDAALLVPAGDGEALTGALDHLIGDDAAREALVSKGRQRAALFTWERCAEQMERLYRDAIQGDVPGGG
jgi:glycosyltransferase involved in cell wall biosynthesis